MQPLLDHARREQVQLASQVSDFYSQLGRCRRAIGEGRTARALFERSMALRRDPLADDVGVVENMADLAALHSDVGQSRQALQGFREALAQLRAAEGDKHPFAVDILRSIGVVQRELGDTDAAEKTFSEAIALADQQLGRQHPSTLSVRRQLAGVYLDRGRLAEAEREFREVQRALIARLGPDHADVGATWSSIGVVLWERNDMPGGFAGAAPGHPHLAPARRRRPPARRAVQLRDGAACGRTRYRSAAGAGRNAPPARAAVRRAAHAGRRHRSPDRRMPGRAGPRCRSAPASEPGGQPAAHRRRFQFGAHAARRTGAGQAAGAHRRTARSAAAVRTHRVR